MNNNEHWAKFVIFIKYNIFKKHQRWLDIFWIIIENNSKALEGCGYILKSTAYNVAHDLRNPYNIFNLCATPELPGLTREIIL